MEYDAPPRSAVRDDCLSERGFDAGWRCSAAVRYLAAPSERVCTGNRPFDVEQATAIVGQTAYNGVR